MRGSSSSPRKGKSRWGTPGIQACHRWLIQNAVELRLLPGHTTGYWVSLEGDQSHSSCLHRDETTVGISTFVWNHEFNEFNERDWREGGRREEEGGGRGGKRLLRRCSGTLDFLLLALLATITAEEEPSKQKQHGEHVEAEDNLGELGRAAIGSPKKLRKDPTSGSVRGRRRKRFLLPDANEVLSEDEKELGQLEVSEVLVPPGLVSEGGNEVVRVHQDVDKGVENSGEVEVASVVIDDIGGDKGDGGVVVDVEEGDLSEGFPQNEDPGVNELPELLGKEHEHEPAQAPAIVILKVARVASEPGKGEKTMNEFASGKRTIPNFAAVQEPQPR